MGKRVCGCEDRATRLLLIDSLVESACKLLGHDTTPSTAEVNRAAILQLRFEQLLAMHDMVKDHLRH